MSIATETPMNNNTTAHFPLSRERFFAAQAQFKAFVKNPDNHPYKDPDEGHKESGEITHHHFIFYAILRGKDPAQTSHNPDCIRYRERLKSVLNCHLSYAQGLSSKLRKAFGLSQDEINAVITNWKDQYHN